MKALVTGSNGFIGSFLVEKLLQENIDVRCLVRRTSNIRWLTNLKIELCYGELSDPASLVAAVKDINIVFHLGGVTRGLRESDYISGNVITTQNLLNACMKHGSEQQKVVYVSSQAAGGPSLDGNSLDEETARHPISMYGRSKLMAELAVLEFSKNRPATIVRPPSVYGPRDTDFYKLFKNARYGFLPVVGGGRQRISIIHVADLVNGIFLAGTNPNAEGKVFFTSSDDDVSFFALANAIATAMNKKVRLVNIPFPVVRLIVAAASVGSFVTKKPSILNMDKYNEMRQPAWVCNNDKAKQILGFQPSITLIDGMRETADWYKLQGWL